MDTFQNRLRQAMDIKNVRAVELASLTGINKGTISRYVNGKIEAKQDALHAIAKALNINEGWLMGYDDVPMERTWAEIKNDQMVKLVIRMKSDDDFEKVIYQISQLKPEELSILRTFMETFLQKRKDEV